MVAGEPGCGVSLSREVTSHRSSGESERLSALSGSGHDAGEQEDDMRRVVQRLGAPWAAGEDEHPGSLTSLSPVP